MRALILLLVVALAGTAIAEVISGNDALLSLVAHRSEKFTRVTGKPQSMPAAVSVLCGYSGATTISSGPLAVSTGTVSGAGPSVSAVLNNPHQGKFYHVYITDPGLKIMKDGKGTYPEGTVVLKEKFSDATAKTTELFTAMVKRQKGFNPEGGDWEYFVISGDAKTVTASGKIQSCINCHDSYQSTDYVTRDYMDNP